VIPRRSQPLVLGLDTATEQSSVALVRGDAVLGMVAATDEHRRGERLAETLRGLLAVAGVAVEDLDAIAVVTGPGSYTGLRVGLALARGLALIDRLPVVGLGSLELLAYAAGDDAGSDRTTLLSAGRNKVFTASYRLAAAAPVLLECTAAATVLDLTGLQAALAAAPHAGVTLCVDAVSLDAIGQARLQAHSGRIVEVAAQRADVLARIGAARVAAGGGVDAERVLPQYVGGSGARPNRNRVAGLREAPE
jgi:tRNA threonylcarbamoyladenosine biosynthesis protein TsaB